MQKLVWQNSNGDVIDLTSGNYAITNWEGFSNTSLNIQSQQVPFQDGGVFLDALMEQRELAVTLAIQDNNNLEERYRMRRELVHALNPKLGEGYLIYTNNFISKRIKCVAQIPLFETHNSNDSGTPKASLAWTACEPYWEDVEETIIQFTNDQFPIVKNNGDIKAQINLELLGSKKNTVIKNLTSGKEVSITGTEQKPLYLSTLVGQKEVYNEKEEYEQKKAYYDFYSNSLCYSEKTFYYYCLIGDKIAKSLDCEKWENINTIDYSIFNNFIRTKCVNDKIFVLGESGLILVSENGNVFTQIAIGVTNENVKDVIFAEDNYLFLTKNTKILQSADLQNWNTITVPKNPLYTDIFYNEGIYFLTGVYESQVSTDLISWTQKDRFVKSTENGLFFTNDAYSSDLQNWTLIGFTATTPVRYNKGIYFCGVNNELKYSYDLVNWQSIVLSHYLLEAYVYNKQYFLMASVEDARELLKGNDITNLSYVQKYPEHPITKIATDTKRNMYIGIAGNYYAESKDLINWEYFYLGNVTLRFITYIPQKDVYILGDNASNSCIYISNDFRNWETVQVGRYGINGVIYVDDWDLFILISGGAGLATSANLRSWTNHFIGMYGDEHGLAYNKYLGVAVVTGTQASVYSYDGLNWLDSGIYSNLGCASSNAQPIIVALNHITVNRTVILMSTNGKNATSITVDYELTDIIFIEELQLFIVVGDGVFGVSIDGVNWQFTETEIFQDYYSLTYSVFEGTITIYSNGECNSLLKIYYAKGENKISTLVENSDLSLGLDIGENQIVVENESERIYCILKFRQKYIGV